MTDAPPTPSASAKVLSVRTPGVPKCGATRSLRSLPLREIASTTSRRMSLELMTLLQACSSEAIAYQQSPRLFRQLQQQGKSLGHRGPGRHSLQHGDPSELHPVSLGFLHECRRLRRQLHRLQCDQQTIPAAATSSFSMVAPRFIKSTINMNTYWSLGTKNGGEVISADSY